ncbi:MAG: phosphoribosylamine--glycine ligase, partial [Bdellovibrionales bacterium]|nr:phosphoribosylamine--glycine ligase [Bdellovibrionales bacterium]
MIPILYRGSVKDVMGPVNLAAQGSGAVPGVLFRFSDAYSVFDWGKMPDPIEGKGAALTVVAAELLHRVSLPQTWKELSRTGEAYDLRNGVGRIPVSGEGAGQLAAPPSASLSTHFNEIGEQLQGGGLRTHYLGVVSNAALARHDGGATMECLSLEEAAKRDVEPPRHLAVRQVNVVPPAVQKVMGRTVRDYAPTRAAQAPKLIPLEVVFRFSVPPGSSLPARAAASPEYAAQLAIPQDVKIEGGRKIEDKRGPKDRVREGDRWAFPVLELFTKLEPTDRPVTQGEALAITGLSAEQLQTLLLKTAWVAGYLRYRFRIAGLELADGKLEWGLDADGELLLVDAIGPDELRILRGGVQISKEFLRSHYRSTPWAAQLAEAKKTAAAKGIADWKKGVSELPPPLPPEKREAASQLYWVLANELTGRRWFKEAWTLDQLCGKLAAFEPQAGRTVLVVGGGGREHALAWKLAQSPSVSRLILAPGNDGMRTRGGRVMVERWEFDAARGRPEFEALAAHARAEKVDLAVIGPDNPLADGLVDVLAEHGVAAFGPRADAARIESSKAFAKQVMKSAGVPTARFVAVRDLEEARKFLRSAPWPPVSKGWVVKADGLALGKGVRVCEELKEAEAACEELLPVSGSLVIEERLEGVELSWMAFCDGERAALLEPARDYKRLKDGHAGPNTGGMGAYSPVAEAADEGLRERVRREVFEPVLKEMRALGTPFQGVLFAGLMMNPSTRQFWVLEFNARFGDPETQVLLPRLEGDL